MMLAGGAEMAALPRDTIYAAMMIICNGVVGLCMLVGGLAHREQSFRVEGAERGHGGADRHVRAVARAAGLHDHHRRAARTALRSSLSSRSTSAVAVGGLRLHPDGPSSRLLPAAVGRRRTRTSTLRRRPNREAWIEFRPAARVARGGRRPRQGAVADDRADWSRRREHRRP